ncbi:MAG: exodeoxyribonuclease VII large subunit [Clostridia bacterium]|nr:exodeoxyribonuclease VII large subunit [Clostridia bacterium]
MHANDAAMTVSEVTRRVANAIGSDPVLDDVWVEGEISNFTHHTSGHMYFTMKDAGSRLRTVMFRAANARLRFRPGNGMEVMAHGHIGLYEQAGEYQLYVDVMEPFGLGGLYLQYLQIKERLAAEGLFDEASKRAIPTFPRCIGVVTSLTGAALRDIIKVSRRRWPGMDILVIPSLVQGEQAPENIEAAIRLANKVNAADRPDVLIVGRGGGSVEDLWAFNDERVARAIRASRIPVVSAVGHETDFTIADFAADLRAPTPSAAAEMVAPDAIAYAKRVELASSRLRREIRSMVDQRRQHVDDLGRWLVHKIQSRLSSSRERLNALSGRLDAMDPMAVLNRGYSVCRLTDGTILRDVRAVGVGDGVLVQLGRGGLGCVVREVHDGQLAEAE